MAPPAGRSVLVLEERTSEGHAGRGAEREASAARLRPEAADLLLSSVQLLPGLLEQSHLLLQLPLGVHQMDLDTRERDITDYSPRL